LELPLDAVHDADLAGQLVNPALLFVGRSAGHAALGISFIYEAVAVVIETIAQFLLGRTLVLISATGSPLAIVAELGSGIALAPVGAAALDLALFAVTAAGNVIDFVVAIVVLPVADFRLGLC